jgi:glycerol-3-phosphate cytidylyltransferase-like family protein
VIRNAPLHITEEYLTLHNIDYVVHGDDISPESMKMMYGVPFELGKFRTVPYTSGISTTDIIRTVLERWGPGPIAKAPPGVTPY